MRVFLGLLLLCAAFPLWADDQDEKAKAVTIYWEDLLPGNADLVKEKLISAGQSIMPEGSGADKGENQFLVVDELDGHKVRIPGFVVPLEFSDDGRISDFLLVPYQGACIHEPPPPPNQVVYAKSDEAQQFPSMWTPIWISGTMSTEQYLNYLGDAAYTMQIEGWEPYRGRE